MSLLRQSLRIAHRLLAQTQTQVSLKDSKNIKRWVAPTLKAIAKRRQAVGPEPEKPRSSYLEWNYDIEIRCFGKRLREKFDEAALKQAFTQTEWANLEEFRAKEAGDESFTPFPHNHELADDGFQIICNCVREKYKSYPEDVVNAVCNYLTTDEMLAHIAKHLGIKDLVRSAEYPPEAKTLADAFKAVVGVLSLSSEPSNVTSFVNDFVVTQMTGKDIYDIWVPEKPYDYLVKLLQDRGVQEVEPRLCNQSASNTILANYQVGLYNAADKSCLGLGWGENVQIAKDTAALNAIQRIYNNYVSE